MSSKRTNLSSRTTARFSGKVIEDFSIQGEGEEWQKQNIVLSNEAFAFSPVRAGRRFEGWRHLHRLKLVVIDDPEDGEWVRTKENRDKTDRWLHSEIIPGMDVKKGKLVVIGNLLHMDALLSRLKAAGTGFKVLEFPLIDKEGKCTWPAMYPTPQSLSDKERDTGPFPWQREMLLKIVADEDQVIKPEDIHYYDEKPKNSLAAMKGHGIDHAASQKDTADYYAIASGEVFYVESVPKNFVRPNPYHRRALFHDFLQHVRNIPGELKGANIFFVEHVAYQLVAIQEMERMMLPVSDEAAGRQASAPTNRCDLHQEWNRSLSQNRLRGIVG